MLKKLKDLILAGKTLTGRNSEEEDQEDYLPKEKVLVFGVSFVLAFCLWFIVNLSRDFNITVDVPLEVGNVPEEMALTNEPPEVAAVGVSGEGWNLISLYNNPPRILLEPDQPDVNLYEIVQRQISVLSDVSIINVDPYRLDLTMEEKAGKEVPVHVDVDIQTRERYEMMEEPVIEPQRVLIRGAASRIEEIDTVFTQPVHLEDVSSNLELELEVNEPVSGVEVLPENILYRVDITELTEGELRVPIRIRNLPPGQAVTYNPSTVTIRYSVPIHQYSEVQNRRPFIAYVDYGTIQADTTGFVVPQVERVDDDYHIRLRNVVPTTVSYFHVLQ